MDPMSKSLHSGLNGRGVGPDPPAGSAPACIGMKHQGQRESAGIISFPKSRKDRGSLRMRQRIRGQL